MAGIKNLGRRLSNFVLTDKSLLISIVSATLLLTAEVMRESVVVNERYSVLSGDYKDFIERKAGEEYSQIAFLDKRDACPPFIPMLRFSSYFVE